jgi:hypothetical protein
MDRDHRQDATASRRLSTTQKLNQPLYKPGDIRLGFAALMARESQAHELMSIVRVGEVMGLTLPPRNRPGLHLTSAARPGRTVLESTSRKALGFQTPASKLPASVASTV